MVPKQLLFLASVYAVGAAEAHSSDETDNIMLLQTYAETNPATAPLTLRSSSVISFRSEQSKSVALRADLSEKGYQKVASFKDDAMMQTFVNRTLKAHKMNVTNLGDLEGFVPHYSGTIAVQSFEKMKSELSDAPWVSPVERAKHGKAINLNASIKLKAQNSQNYTDWRKHHQQQRKQGQQKQKTELQRQHAEQKYSEWRDRQQHQHQLTKQKNKSQNQQQTAQKHPHQQGTQTKWPTTAAQQK